MTVKVLIEHLLEFVSLKGGCTGSSEYRHVKCHIVGYHMFLERISVDLHFLINELLMNKCKCKLLYRT